MAKWKDPERRYVVSTSSAAAARWCWCVTWTTVGLVVCAAGAVLLWPWEPEVRMGRLAVRRVKVHPLPPLRAEVWLSTTVTVHNRGLYWMEVAGVDVGIKYRGFKLGHVESKGWHVRGWGSTRVFGDLESSGLPSADVAHLIHDLAKGRVHFHALAKVTGHLGLLFYDFPRTFKTMLSCEVFVNTKNHTIEHQHCLYKKK